MTSRSTGAPQATIAAKSATAQEVPDFRDGDWRVGGFGEFVEIRSVRGRGLFVPRQGTLLMDLLLAYSVDVEPFGFRSAGW
ncbi:hypothetical protein NOU13_32235 [Rhodococcus erythropolis]|uniref:hypothetical protein n=1 Tax=Rhodococcus erythropolis TaxID=1833 RepID=UPI00210BA12A|nr:hypothetical protein [Rhodococcus erythropolis]MCQ4129176.1 hypothetical protein [Rhodococcus erythropolis]